MNPPGTVSAYSLCWLWFTTARLDRLNHILSGVGLPPMTRAVAVSYALWRTPEEWEMIRGLIEE